MNVVVFLQTFYLIFLVLIAVGPGFLTIANIAMTHGYKTSAIAVCGCFLGDCILITLGVFFAKKTIAVIPETILTSLSFIAVILLCYLAYKFFTNDVSKLKTKTLDKKNGLSLAVSLFCLKMSSPICIISYSIIFTQIIKTSNAYISACLGGYFASIVVNTFMVITFGTIGKKINLKVLNFLNKFSATFISSFAMFILFTTIKKII